MCEAELRINRRAAPELYRRVVAVVRRADGRLSLDGDGTPVEWLVEMARFDQERLFDRLAARKALAIDLMPPLASAIASFHKGAQRRPDQGGAAGMAWVIDGNALGFAEQGTGILDADASAALTRRSRAALERNRQLLEVRRVDGMVRQCHGDLHLRNIVLLDRGPTLFDAVEFDDRIACIDVLYDFAFLLMDLWRRHLPLHANVVWNGYLVDTDDVNGIALLPLFLSCRAAVRAKTSATAARLERDPARRIELQQASCDYLALARQLLEPPRPCLIAIGGFSGSGKSTVAKRIAPLVGPVPGAVVVRSDEIRKRLCGVEPSRRLGPDGYTPQVTQQVYATIAERAIGIVRSGHAAIVDAVYARAGDRLTIERAAADAGIPFSGLWLDAPESVLVTRVGRRSNDASDADAAVIRRQLAEDTGFIAWPRVDASSDEAAVSDSAATILRSHLSADVVRRSEAA
jgi:aminoglycoside phosphotransferase family enzyme/predicted kinase